MTSTSAAVLLLTSPRVAPGLLTVDAWDRLRAAARVGCGSADHPQRAAVEAAGVAVEVLVPAPGDGVAAAALAWLMAGVVGETRIWLADNDDRELSRLVASEVMRRAEVDEPGLEFEVFIGSADLPGSRLLDLVAVMDQLRTRCPWDAAQTHESLIRYLVEETYETLEAVETGDRDHLREELGDLLLQVMFHARIAAEDPDDPWTVDDVAADIVDKMIRRHPHVFSGEVVADAAQVQSNWDDIKHAEKHRTSVLDGIPLALPSLALADKLLGRAARVGVALPVRDALADDHDRDHDRGGVERELGTRLLEMVAEARETGTDPEHALRTVLRDLADRIRAAESPS